MPTKSTAERIAANVRAEAARRQVTQAALAAHLGLTQPGMSRRMLGRVPFSAAELVSVTELLGTSLDDLTECVEAAS